MTILELIPDESGLAIEKQSLIFRLKKRAEIRRQITSRKSVQQGEIDGLADLLEEAALKILELEDEVEFLNNERIYGVMHPLQ